MLTRVVVPRSFPRAEENERRVDEEDDSGERQVVGRVAEI